MSNLLERLRRAFAGITGGNPALVTRWGRINAAAPFGLVQLGPVLAASPFV